METPLSISSPLSPAKISGVVSEFHTLVALQVINIRGLVFQIMNGLGDATTSPPFSGLGLGLLFKTTHI